MKLTPFWKPSDKVLLAISGGIDSMVLLHLFAHLPLTQRPQLMVASVNHGMRVQGANDVAHVKKWCQVYHIPFYTNSIIPKHLNSEEEARTYRYGFFQHLVDEQACDYLVTAHHASDQVETILFKLIRGSSLQGISGMSVLRQWYKTCQLARPLLPYTKQDIERYAKEKHLAFVVDETNEQLNYTRNRIRKLIVPQLENEQDNLCQHFADFSQDLKDVLSIVRESVASVYDHVCIDNRLHKIELLKYTLPMQKEIIAKWLRDNHVLERHHVISIIDLLQTQQGEKKIQLSVQLWCVLSYDWLILTAHQPINKQSILENEYVLHDAVVYLTQQRTQESIISVSKDQLPITLRQRQSGDVFKLKHYTKKINRIFIDEKIPAYQRDDILLAVDTYGAIIAILHPKLLPLSKQQETGKIKPYYLNYRKREK